MLNASFNVHNCDTKIQPGMLILVLVLVLKDSLRTFSSPCPCPGPWGSGPCPYPCPWGSGPCPCPGPCGSGPCPCPGPWGSGPCPCPCPGPWGSGPCYHPWQTPAEQSLYGRDNAECNAGAGGDRSRFATLGRCMPSWSDECRRGLRGHGQPPPTQQHQVQWSSTGRPASPEGGSPDILGAVHKVRHA